MTSSQPQADRIRIRDLGPMVVEMPGSVIELGATKQAALLSVLTAQVGRQVSVDALMAAGWGIDAAVSMPSLESQVWRLRNLLEPIRRRTAAVLVRDGGGYRLTLDADQVDSRRFERLAGLATAKLRAGDSAAALQLIEEALALWRGEPFEAVVDDVGTATAARWRELHDQLGELRIDALLDLDSPDRALVDLEALIDRNPLRERLWWQRMTALARVNRIEEALAAYRHIARLLQDELGLTPDSDLQALHLRILDRDLTVIGPVSRSGTASADGTPPTSAGPDQRSSAPAQDPPRAAQATSPRLPRRSTSLIGRDADLARLTTLLAQRPLVTITGSGGCGKTRLAIEVAATVATDFPDGVWFVDLTTVTSSALVIDVIVSTLALQPSQALDPLQALTDFVRNKRLLLVLDNCEHVLEGVAEALEDVLAAPAATPGVAVLATSREPIGLDDEQIWSISPLSLLSARHPQGDNPDSHGATSSSPAVRLFIERVLTANPELTFDAKALELTAKICRDLDGLPLAIELAAARTRWFQLAQIAEQVQADPTRLARVGRRRADHRQSLYEAIEWSYLLLPSREQALHRCLSVLPGPFTLAAALGVAPAGFDEYEVADALLGLAHRSMLDVREVEASPSTTYVQLDTVRAHAYRRLQDEGESAATLDSRDLWVISLLARRPRLGQASTPAWFDELEMSYPIVRAALQRAVSPDGDPRLISLGATLGFFWYLRPRLLEGCRWLESAQAVAHQSVDSTDNLIIHLQLVGALLLCYRPEPARRHLKAVLPQLGAVENLRTEVVAEALFGAAGGAWAGAAPDLLTTLSATLTDLAATTDDRLVRLLADIIACAASIPRGHFDQARARAAELYARSIEADNLICAWFSALAACAAATESLRSTEALDWARRVLGLHERLGSGGSKAFLETVGNSLALSQNYHQALRLYAAASTHARQGGSSWPEHPRTKELFELTTSLLEPAEFELAWAQGQQLSIHELIHGTGEGDDPPTAPAARLRS